MDYGERMTQRDYQALVHKLNGVYREAANDLKMKAASWAHAHEARVKKYRAQVARGEITEADYRAWMRGQLFQERAWRQKQRQLAETMAAADETALKMVNSGKIDVFAKNANYLGYSVERALGVDVGFGLYDRAAVTRLIRDEPTLLPMPRIAKDRDIAWYNRVIGNAVTQGILQGEDLDGITMRVALETGEKSLDAMRRNARTAYTGAQNAGRQEGMRQAKLLGVVLKKRWMCTLDGHTRDAHAELDGQEADVEEAFQSSLGPIMYPGDPSADPANVYNCRCTMVQVNPERPAYIDRRDESGARVGALTYRQWAEGKASAGNE